MPQVGRAFLSVTAGSGKGGEKPWHRPCRLSWGDVLRYPTPRRSCQPINLSSPGGWLTPGGGSAVDSSQRSLAANAARVGGPSAALQCPATSAAFQLSQGSPGRVTVNSSAVVQLPQQLPVVQPIPFCLYFRVNGFLRMTAAATSSATTTETEGPRRYTPKEDICVSSRLKRNINCKICPA